jgi:fatty acid desaturase
MTSKVIQNRMVYAVFMPDFTSPNAITWYRCPLPKGEFKKLHERSDLLGGLQTVGYLGVITCTAAAVLYSAGHGPWWVTTLLLLLHGMMYAYLINAVHELCHGTVFRTKLLNEIFVRVTSFLCMSNYIGFQQSHARHHRYTLHQPDDQEVKLPVAKVLVRHFILTGIVNPMGIKGWLTGNARVACGRIEGEWENLLFPAGSAERREFVNWQRTMIAGHLVLILGSIYFHLWLLPVLVTLGPFYGGWLQSMANGTQHVGLQDDVSDFRLCCRTFTVNPVIQFLYWHMNYHIEHHMFAAVPCYRLGRLHRLIKHDLPPCPHGMIATWKEIAAIQKIQETDPTYEHVAVIPQRAEERAPLAA